VKSNRVIPGYVLCGGVLVRVACNSRSLRTSICLSVPPLSVCLISGPAGDGFRHAVGGFARGPVWLSFGRLFISCGNCGPPPSLSPPPPPLRSTLCSPTARPPPHATPPPPPSPWGVVGSHCLLDLVLVPSLLRSRDDTSILVT